MHLKHINKGTYLKPVREEKDAFQVAGLMTLVRGDQAVTTELWDVFAQQLERLENAIGPRDYYGIAWYPGDWPDRGFLYMAAIGIQGLDGAHTALVVKAIPAWMMESLKG